MVNVGHKINGRTGDPSHHLALQEVDGSNKTGFICVGAEDNAIMPDVQVRSYSGQATKIQEGRSKWSDKRPPFLDVGIDDFLGGIGMLYHDEDASRYLEGYMLNSSQEGQVMNQGFPRYTKGLRDFNEHMPENDSRCYWTSLYKDGTEDIEVSFTTEAAYTADKVRLYIRKVGSPTGNLEVALRTSGDADMDTELVDVSTLPTEAPYWIEVDLSDDDALSDATTYKINLNYNNASSDADNYIQVWYDSVASKFMYRILDDTAPFRVQMLEYKGALYGVTIPDDDSASNLYIYGDRGQADPNTGALTTLVDASKTWTVNEWAGAIVKLVAGNNDEETPWRTVVSNTANTLTLDSAWEYEHSTRVSYVIHGVRWTSVQALPKRITDAVSSGENIYFGYGYPAGDTDFYPDRFWGEAQYNFSTSVYEWVETIETEDNNGHGFQKMCFIPNEGKTPNPWEGQWSGKLYSSAISQDENKLMGFDVAYGSKVDVVKFLDQIWNPYDTAWIGSSYTNVSNKRSGPSFYASVGADFVTGKIAHLKLDSPVDMSTGFGVVFTFGVYPATAGKYDGADDLRLVFADEDGNEEYVQIGGVTEDNIATEFFFFPRGLYYNGLSCDVTNITDVYIDCNLDDGAFLMVMFGLDLVSDRGYSYDNWYNIPFTNKLNNLIPYAGGAGETDMKPWLLTSHGAYFVEQELLKRIPLGEAAELSHPRSGEGACVNGPYIYWNMGEKIMRYYAGQLDDIGPDLDYGLPEERRGIPASAASYPGAVLFGWDCETSDKYSHVMYRRKHGWHELYRSPVAGERIREIHIVGNSDKPDEVFISEGADVLAVPFDLNPETKTGFEFAYHGSMVTSRIFCTTRETKKYFHALELIQMLHPDASSPKQRFRVYYRTDASASWTLLDNFLENSTNETEEVLIGAYNKSGTWIQFMVELEAEYQDYSPILVGMVLDAVERVITRNSYNYTLEVREGKDDTLNGFNDDTLGYLKINQLDTWADQELPLVLRSNSIYEDLKYVFIEPTSTKATSQRVDENGHEIRTYKLTLLEVE